MRWIILPFLFLIAYSAVNLLTYKTEGDNGYPYFAPELFDSSCYSEKYSGKAYHWDGSSENINNEDAYHGLYLFVKYGNNILASYPIKIEGNKLYYPGMVLDITPKENIRQICAGGSFSNVGGFTVISVKSLGEKFYANGKVIFDRGEWNSNYGYYAFSVIDPDTLAVSRMHLGDFKDKSYTFITRWLEISDESNGKILYNFVSGIAGKFGDYYGATSDKVKIKLTPSDELWYLEETEKEIPVGRGPGVKNIVIREENLTVKQYSLSCQANEEEVSCTLFYQKPSSSLSTESLENVNSNQNSGNPWNTIEIPPIERPGRERCVKIGKMLVCKIGSPDYRGDLILNVKVKCGGKEKEESIFASPNEDYSEITFSLDISDLPGGSCTVEVRPYGKENPVWSSTFNHPYLNSITNTTNIPKELEAGSSVTIPYKVSGDDINRITNREIYAKIGDAQFSSSFTDSGEGTVEVTVPNNLGRGKELVLYWGFNSNVNKKFSVDIYKNFTIEGRNAQIKSIEKIYGDVEIIENKYVKLFDDKAVLEVCPNSTLYACKNITITPNNNSPVYVTFDQVVFPEVYGIKILYPSDGMEFKKGAEINFTIFVNGSDLGYLNYKDICIKRIADDGSESELGCGEIPSNVGLNDNATFNISITLNFLGNQTDVVAYYNDISDSIKLSSYWDVVIYNTSISDSQDPKGIEDVGVISGEGKVIFKNDTHAIVRIYEDGVGVEVIPENKIYSKTYLSLDSSVEKVPVTFEKITEPTVGYLEFLDLPEEVEINKTFNITVKVYGNRLNMTSKEFKLRIGDQEYTSYLDENTLSNNNATGNVTFENISIGYLGKGISVLVFWPNNPQVNRTNYIDVYKEITIYNDTINFTVESPNGTLVNATEISPNNWSVKIYAENVKVKIIPEGYPDVRWNFSETTLNSSLDSVNITFPLQDVLLESITTEVNSTEAFLGKNISIKVTLTGKYFENIGDLGYSNNITLKIGNLEITKPWDYINETNDTIIANFVVNTSEIGLGNYTITASWDKAPNSKNFSSVLVYWNISVSGQNTGIKNVTGEDLEYDDNSNVVKIWRENTLATFYPTDKYNFTEKNITLNSSISSVSIEFPKRGIENWSISLSYPEPDVEVNKTFSFNLSISANRLYFLDDFVGSKTVVVGFEGKNYTFNWTEESESVNRTINLTPRTVGRGKEVVIYILGYRNETERMFSLDVWKNVTIVDNKSNIGRISTDENSNLTFQNSSLAYLKVYGDSGINISPLDPHYKPIEISISASSDIVNVTDLWSYWPIEIERVRGIEIIGEKSCDVLEYNTINCVEVGIPYNVSIILEGNNLTNPEGIRNITIILPNGTEIMKEISPVNDSLAFVNMTISFDDVGENRISTYWNGNSSVRNEKITYAYRRIRIISNSTYYGRDVGIGYVEPRSGWITILNNSDKMAWEIGVFNQSFSIEIVPENSDFQSYIISWDISRGDIIVDFSPRIVTLDLFVNTTDVKLEYGSVLNVTVFVNSSKPIENRTLSVFLGDELKASRNITTNNTGNYSFLIALDKLGRNIPIYPILSMDFGNVSGGSLIINIYGKEDIYFSLPPEASNYSIEVVKIYGDYEGIRELTNKLEVLYYQNNTKIEVLAKDQEGFWMEGEGILSTDGDNITISLRYLPAIYRVNYTYNGLDNPVDVFVETRGIANGDSVFWRLVDTNGNEIRNGSETVSNNSLSFQIPWMVGQYFLEFYYNNTLLKKVPLWMKEDIREIRFQLKEYPEELEVGSQGKIVILKDPTYTLNVTCSDGINFSVQNASGTNESVINVTPARVGEFNCTIYLEEYPEVNYTLTIWGYKTVEILGNNSGISGIYTGGQNIYCYVVNSKGYCKLYEDRTFKVFVEPENLTLYNPFELEISLENLSYALNFEERSVRVETKVVTETKTEYITKEVVKEVPVIKYVYVEKVKYIGKEILELLKRLGYDKIPEFSTKISEIESAIDRNDTQKLFEAISSLTKKLKEEKPKELEFSVYSKRENITEGYRPVYKEFNVSAKINFDKGIAEITFSTDEELDLILVRFPKSLSAYGGERVKINGETYLKFENTSSFSVVVPIADANDFLNYAEVYAFKKPEVKVEQPPRITGLFARVKEYLPWGISFILASLLGMIVIQGIAYGRTYKKIESYLKEKKVVMPSDLRKKFNEKALRRVLARLWRERRIGFVGGKVVYFG